MGSHLRMGDLALDGTHFHPACSILIHHKHGDAADQASVTAGAAKSGTRPRRLKLAVLLLRFGV